MKLHRLTPAVFFLVASPAYQKDKSGSKIRRSENLIAFIRELTLIVFMRRRTKSSFFAKLALRERLTPIGIWQTIC
ncbi:hypothetical protein A2125_01775 [Candidatus Woesebacteria bacterium GWB1_43_5]|uniref:Uncharacterized protein n=1 Tax=Candidatus Woesebacteria bacterium GWB1_43_5 TaxID=1802474 RepID=A0A1F7WR29_9BACT|nr:MAG: hypothetical protein A2125_01775 [Candidatus Woesebacteria bacterium GWB1_43_5]